MHRLTPAMGGGTYERMRYTVRRTNPHPRTPGDSSITREPQAPGTHYQGPNVQGSIIKEPAFREPTTKEPPLHKPPTQEPTTQSLGTHYPLPPTHNPTP